MFDLSVCGSIYGWLAGLTCVVVVATSGTKHDQVHRVHCLLHKATSDSVL